MNADGLSFLDRVTAYGGCTAGVACFTASLPTDANRRHLAGPAGPIATPRSNETDKKNIWVHLRHLRPTEHGVRPNSTAKSAAQMVTTVMDG